MDRACRVGWGLFKGILERCPIVASQGRGCHTSEDIFKGEGERGCRGSSGPSPSKFQRLASGRRSCPLTWGWAGGCSKLPSERGKVGGRRGGVRSLVFPSLGGECWKARDSNAACLFRNKATRRPTTAPTISYSSSTAMVSA